MGQSAFDARSPKLHWPPSEPATDEIDIVLRQNAQDISGGNSSDLTYTALDFDRRIFTLEKFRINSEFEQSAPLIHDGIEGWKILYAIYRSGWRGDQYEPILITGKMSFETLAEAKADPNRHLPPSWIPQTVMRSRDGKFALIEMGQSHRFWSSWKVSDVTADGFVERCKIEFSADDDQDGLAAFPRQVRTLAAMLDDALGPGFDEGTLQPTARIRAEVGYAWKNVAVRPWAEPLLGPYNSTEEVNAGLDRWARVNGERSAVRRKIERLYPAAERALAGYYRKTFPRIDADALARMRLDQMYRAYFVFPKAR